MPARKAVAVRGEEPWRDLIKPRPGERDLDEAKYVPVALIDVNPEQPRKGDLLQIEELASSIAEYGLLQPIVVAPSVTGRYTVIAGHRRLAAYKHLFERTEESRWATIPAIERSTDASDRLVLALVENLSRQDLTDAEIVAGLGVLHDLRGWNQAEIARRLGVSRAWITQYFRVARDPVISEHVQVQQMSVATAYDIVRAESDHARNAALRAALNGAPRRVVRLLAKDAVEEWEEGASNSTSEEETPSSSTDVGEGDTDSGHQSTASRAQGKQTNRAATATLDAGVRDLADLANALSVTGNFRDLQITKLIRSALENGAEEFDAAAFLRLVRADIRHVEAMIRSASRQPGKSV